MSLVVVPVMAAVGIAGIVASPAQAAPTGVGGLTVTSSDTVTSSSGSTVGSLAANDASTRGDVTVLGVPDDPAQCAAGAAGAAQILRRSGTSWVAEQRLAHPEPVDGPAKSRLVCSGEFGQSVSTDGARVAVAARFRAGDTETSTGAVYVYDRDEAGAWKLAATIAPPDFRVVAVSISGDRLAVAGQRDADAGGGPAVATYTRGPDVWTADPETLDGGAPLSLDGTSIAYTTPGGRVAIADRTASGWNVGTEVNEQVVALAAGGLFDTTTSTGILVPARVLLQDDTLTVAEAAYAGTAVTGRVELYARGTGGWASDGRLVDPAHPTGSASFGTTGALSRDGGRVVVGAAADREARPYGAAYVFVRTGGTWELEQPVAPATPAESGFGDEVALSGTVLGVVAGAVNRNWGDVLSYDASTGTRTSAVNGKATGASHRLGWQADVDRDVAAALTLEDEVFGSTLSRAAGALHVYGRDGARWVEQARLTSPAATQGLDATLRGPVVVSGNDVYAVGRTTGGRDTLLRFTRSNGTWAYADQVPAAEGALPDITDVAVARDQMIVSTVAEGTAAPNRTLAFRRVDGRWTFAQDLGPVGSSEVRMSLTTDGSVLALAARGNLAVPVFRRTAGGWQQSEKLTLPDPPVQPEPEFDAAGDLAVVNAFGKPWVAFFAPDPSTADRRLTENGTWTSPDPVTTFGAGAAAVGTGFLVSRTDPVGITHLEVLERSGTKWGTTGEFAGGTRAPFDDFGTVVAADAKTLLVAAPGTNSDAGREAGAVHLYALAGGDTTPPTVTGTPDRDADATIDRVGWWKAPVTVTWTATDDGSGLAGPVPAPTKVTREGRTAATSAEVCDKAGNCTEGSYTVGIDTTAPVVTISGVADETYVLGSEPTATCSATDELTGVDGPCTVTVNGGNANKVGRYTVRATAKDRVGNVGTAEAVYEVHYPWSGFSQPINDTAHEVSATTSVFKAGSTVPVKFTLRDAAGRVLSPTSTPVWVTPVKGSSTSLPVGEPEFTDVPDAGTVYQLRDGQWKYNWKTDRSQAGSYWRIGVRLDDGSVHQVTIALQ